MTRISIELYLAHSGIILATRHPSSEIARRLLLILNNVTAAELRYQVRYI